MIIFHDQEDIGQMTQHIIPYNIISHDIIPYHPIMSIRQKRPIHQTKETYSSDKRDLFIRQKRHIHQTKETYSSDKRDTFIRQKRPIH